MADLIGTKEAAELLGKSVATLNRWAADGRSDRPQPAVSLPGETGARLYQRADVEAYKVSEDERLARFIASGACATCTLEERIPTRHADGVCPNESAVAS